MEHELRMFATVDGLQVKCRPVAGFLIDAIRLAVRKEFRERGEPITAPTYTIITASGATETHLHDDTTLQTDEDRATWAAYQDALRQLDREEDLRITRALLLEGICCDDPPAGWAERISTRYGIAVPDDPDERRIMYLQTDILKTKEDMRRALATVSRLSMAGAPEEDIQAVETSFLGAMARPSDQGHPITGG